MRKPCIIAATALIFFSCNLEPKNHTAEIQKMEDTLFKSFPTVNRVSIEVKDDFGTEVNITLGDAELYKAPETERQKVVQEATLITRHVFEKSNPVKGNLIFVQEENTIKVDEATAKKYVMDFPKD